MLLLLMIYMITPVAKPRMTRSDKWKRRPCVTKYWAFKDECKAKGVQIPDGAYHIHFILPMPKSWGKKKKSLMLGTEHKQVPDKDNLEKSVLDALYIDDAHVSDGRATKWWGTEGCIIVEAIEPAVFPL